MRILVNQWLRRFSFAFRGLAISLRDQPSLQFHAFAMFVVIATGIFLHLDWWRWSVVTLAITMVVSAELMNSAIETLVKALHPHRDQRIADALDTAASAVLVAAIGAVAVSIFVLV